MVDHELNQQNKEPSTVDYSSLKRLRWAGHLKRMSDV